jgi:ATP-binding cassette subfamily B protein
MSVLLRIAAYGWRHKLLFVAAGVAVSVSIVPRTIVPWLLGTAIDEAMTSGLQGQLLLAAGFIGLAALARGVLGYANVYLAEAISQRVAYDLRKDFFRKLQGLSFGFYDRQQTGDLMSKATVDVDAVRMFIGFGLLQSVGMATAFGLTAFLMLTTNWRLGLIGLAFMPVVIWPSIVMALRLNPVFSKMHEELGYMNAVVQENLMAMRVVKAFGARDYEKAKFERRARAVSDHFNTAGKVFVSRSSVMSFIFLGNTAAILMFGGREVMLGRLTPGDLAAFILYMGLLAMPVQMIGWRVQLFSRAFAAGRRIFDVLDAESPVNERPGARTLPRVRGHVRFERVTFSYDGRGPVVRDVDFEVQPGQTVAFLGGPGSGKSSVVHLIPRFYEVSSGRVTMDGIDVRDATLVSLRANVGIVLQDVFAFSATIRDNIAYGVDEAPLEDVVRAAKIAELHEFSSKSCPTPTIPRSGSAASHSRAASANGSPSPGPSWRTRPSSSSTTRPPAST